MAARCDPLEKITPIRECWRVKVRVVRLWYLPSFNNAQTINSIEMVFMDEFVSVGTTMHASVRKTLVYKFKPLLTEGQVYIIAYFGVGGNTGYFRTTRHEYRLNFQLRTTIKPSESLKIPLHGCKFIPFDEIFQSDADFPYLVDVIGLLTAVGTEKEYDKDGKRTKMIVIEQDVDNVKLEVALFGDYADQVNNFVANGDVNLPIIILQYAKVKTFKGKIVLQNVMYGTRLLFNPEIPEVLDFKKSLGAQNPESSHGFGILSDAPYYSIEDDFLKVTPRKTIEELKDCKEDGLYIVYGTVNAVINGPDWWYAACKCNKAVIPDSGMYYCERCFCHVVNVIPRYRIKVNVIDQTGSATFVLWDRDSSVLLKKSCSDLLETIQKNSGPLGHPPEFEDHLIQKSFLFKVEVKENVNLNFAPSFKVIKLCSNASIIAKFQHFAESSQHLSAECSAKYHSIHDDFLKLTPAKSIELLKDCKDDGFYIVYATVKGINNGPDWWFAACKCGHQVSPDSGMYYCENCQSHVVKVIPRYHIKLRVIDHFDSATFVLWDREAFSLLQKSCSNLLETIQNRGGPVGLPVEIEDMIINKSFLFKVEIKAPTTDQFEPCYNVNNFSVDDSIISTFKEIQPSFFTSEPDFTVGLSLGKHSLSMEFEDVKSSVSKNLLNEFTEGDGIQFSQAENELPELTPAKRDGTQFDVSVDGSASTTKLKSVKIEKH